jgi:flavin-dependent dehydrogenase
MALVAYYEGISELTDHGMIVVGNRSYCILNRIGERLINASIVVDQEVVQDRKGQLDELFESTLQAFPLARGALRDTERRKPIRCLGPLAFRTSRNVASGALLIGDAAGFHDPFTGEGVGHALYGAALAADEIASALADGNEGLTEPRLAQLDRRQRNALRNRERLGIALQAIIRRPRAANAAARLLSRCQPLADLLLGVIGDLLPPQALFSTSALSKVFYRA